MLERILQLIGQSPKGLSADQMQTIQKVAEQVVLSVEQTMKMSGPAKKELAMKVASEILADSGILAPERLLDTAIEAAVRVMTLLERITQPKAS